jgi:hypothetical protein
MEVQKGLLRLAASLTLGFALIGLPGALRAQSTLGTILGTVTDSSGAVVPNCDVKITLNEEGALRTLKTDPNGNYEAVNSKPGHYTVEVSDTGFQTSRVENLELAARQTLRVDITLKVGQMAQTVEVKATSAGVINTETETVSSAYNTLEITNLPTNYRASGNGNSPYYLLEILPGMQTDQSGNLSIQGGLQSQSQFSVDGISITDVTGNSPLHNAFPSAESISEMKVQGVGSPAEFGDPGDVTTTSKSGTNALHGSTFWYHQNAALNALPFGAIVKPAEIANDFGGSAGGPVVIPHLYNGKNKTFFFADYEGFRLPRTSTIENTVPTSAMRTGDMSYLCTSGFSAAGVCNDRDSKGNLIDQIYNPYTGTVFADNQIPSGMINSASTAFLGLYPTPNVGSIFTDNNYRTNLPANLTSNGFDVRGDQYFGSKLSVTGRFTFKNIPSLSPEELSIPSSTNYEHVRMLAASATYTIKPTLVDEFRFGLTDDHSGTTNPYDGKSFTTALGFENINDLWWDGLPDLSFSGPTTGLGVGRMNSVSQSSTLQFADNLSWIKGRHTFKFGMDAQKMRAVTPLGFFGADNYGSYGFNGAFTGNDFSDFLLGLPAESDLDNVQLDNDGRNHKIALFAQDSFRVSRRLTLELGLRWEYHPGYTDASGQIGNFIQTPLSGGAVYPDGAAKLLATSFLQSFDACPTPGLPRLASDPTSANGAPCTPVVTASQDGISEGLRATSKRFMPRFGFAYKLTNDDKTVVRGGIGAYQASTLGSVYYSLTGTLQSYTNTYYNTLTNGVPGFVWPETSTGAAAGASYGTAYFGTANTIDWKEPYSVQWNLSVERDLGFGTGLRISYIGMRTTNLVWAPNLNQSLPSTIPYADQPLSSRPYPNWGVVNIRASGATASFNEAQVELTHRFGAGLALDSTYSWSRSLADNQGAGNAGSLCGETACNRSADLYDRRSEYGNTYAPYTNNWVSTLVYQLPVGRGKRFANTSNKILDGVIGGWQTNNIFTVHSGPWLTPYFTGGDPSGTGSGIIGRAQHPDRIGPAYPATPNSSEWFLGSGFACPTGNCSIGEGGKTPPPIGRFGTSGVGILQGPGTIDWDFGVSKSFNLTERAKLRVEVSFVNVLNHLNLGNPDLNIVDTNNPSTGQCGFGCITSAQGLFQFAGARQGQVSARIDF